MLQLGQGVVPFFFDLLTDNHRCVRSLQRGSPIGGSSVWRFRYCPGLPRWLTPDLRLCCAISSADGPKPRPPFSTSPAERWSTTSCRQDRARAHRFHVSAVGDASEGGRPGEGSSFRKWLAVNDRRYG